MGYDYEWIDGERVEVHVGRGFRDLRAAFRNDWGLDMLVSSGVRTRAKQAYLHDGWVRRLPGFDLAAPPGYSNHEETGPIGPRALDVRDSGADAGVTVIGTPRADWLYRNAPRFGFDPAGYRFRPREGWHIEWTGALWGPVPAFTDVTIPAPPPPPKPKELTVRTYRVQDATARAAGRVIPPGDRFYVAADNPDARVNLIGGVGPYTVTLHLYGKGTPGDAVDVNLVRSNVQEMKDSPHYIHRFVVDRDGDVFGSVSFQIDAPLGSAIYARATAVSTNTAPVRVTLFDSDAYLFTVQ